jgi:uncharacterized protein (DUF362 family)
VKVSISRNKGIVYPPVEEHSPDISFPEYPFPQEFLSPSNAVYAMVRQCLQEYGCNREKFDTPFWNPLGEWINKGDRVFVLPNFVIHRRPWESIGRFRAKCTHSSVIRPVMDYAVIAAGNPGLVSFGNAPLQSCDYARVTKETGASSIARFYKELTGADIGPRDLRLLRSRWTNFGALVSVEKECTEDAVLFDLGRESYLDALYGNGPGVRVRVGDYPPDETMSHHGYGKHIYVVNRKLLESEVIISVPKLKTHQKVGITCALKGTVGTIGRKECLAHHRKGSPPEGGDEYPMPTTLRDVSSDMSDKACTLGTGISSNLYRVVSKVLARGLRIGRKGITYGAWHGNDTAWRMVLDIARILRYGRLDGTMAKNPVRKHLALVDGIVAGEDEGPMTPVPRHSGVVIFGPDICAVDAACAYIMGFDPRKIQLVGNSFASGKYPLTEGSIDEIDLSYNGRPAEIHEILRAFTPSYKPPKGWVGKIEAGPDMLRQNV